MSDTAETVTIPERRSTRWIFPTIAIVAAFFYAYDLWEGIGNIVGFTGLLGAALPAWLWTILIASALVPVLCYVAAYFTARRVRLLGAAVVFVVGLAASACLGLSLNALMEYVVLG